ncbi:DNA adenine methylase [Weissella confusa]|uniref:DNA adenine methylase n=1 Tax=Weissella confusa TaxID=1583 RepID=UPI001FD96726|nr:DNA adenine methylase [Weissella confusa]
MRPFIKWVGGKRQLLPELAKYVPENFGTYFEPFLGGGTFLLSLEPNKAIVNDFNPELANVWRVVRDQPDELLAQLVEHQANNSKEYYLDLRLTDRDGRLEQMTEIERAARFIYMIKVGFNGLWRVNSKGQNNVPYGKYKNPKIADEVAIHRVSEYLNNADIDILTGDFEKAVEKAQTGDFVYFDPPYIPASDTASFTSYSSEFGYDEQVRLRDLFKKLKDRGVYVLLSNNDVPLLHELYEGVGVIETVEAHRFVAAKASSRAKVSEVLVRSWG